MEDNLFWEKACLESNVTHHWVLVRFQCLPKNSICKEHCLHEQILIINPFLIRYEYCCRCGFRIPVNYPEGMNECQE